MDKMRHLCFGHGNRLQGATNRRSQPSESLVPSARLVRCVLIAERLLIEIRGIRRRSDSWQNRWWYRTSPQRVPVESREPAARMVS